MTKEQEDKIIQDATEYVKGMNQGMERMRARQGYIAGATSRTTESQPSSDQIAGMRKDMDMALEREKELIAALDQAVILIRRWHDMYDKKSNKDTLDEIWRIYYDKSPEMKLIREALASYNQSPSTGEQEDEIKIRKIADGALSRIKETPNHITTQLSKDEITSYNTGFFAGFYNGYITRK